MNVRECTGYGTLQIIGSVQGMERWNITDSRKCTGDGTILKVCTPIGNDPSLYTPKCGQIQFDNRLKWTRTENCFDKLTEVRNFTRALTECTGDGAYICITSGENGFEGLTSGSTSRAAPSQLKTTYHFNCCGCLFIIQFCFRTQFRGINVIVPKKTSFNCLTQS